MSTKMVIIMRTDLKMKSGKMVAQGAHSCVMRVKDELDYGNQLAKSMMTRWYTEGQRKVCLKVSSLQELKEIEAEAFLRGIGCARVIDRDLTELYGEPTQTCIALGPEPDEVLDPVTGELELL